MTGYCSAAISDNSDLLNSKTIKADKGYSEIIIPLIDSLLKKTQLTVSQLNGLLVCTGPGNYTSSRGAISTTRGLSLACKIPACGISLFELLSTDKAAVLVMVKGPEEKLYVQKFSYGVAVTSPRLMTISEITRTDEFFYSETIGYRAIQVGQLIKSNNCVDNTVVCFEKFFRIGIKKLNSKCPRPTPLYVK